VQHLIAIDQGTTSSRALVFDEALKVAGLGQTEFPQHFPHPGWVEHDPEDIWNSTVQVVRDAMATAGVEASDIAAIGITNQRETTVIWDRSTGKPIHNAIVWQDRRTAATCEALRARGLADEVTQQTGLLLDPYFSATKVAWLLDHVDGARARAEAGELAFGTVDTWLMWRLTGGRVHATDATNACRTLLYDVNTGTFTQALADTFGVPMALLPEIRDSSGDFGTTDPALFGGAIRIGGVAGDQQAATVGQACFLPGMAKSTYGTGAFLLLNTGETPVPSRNRMLTTVAYQLGGKRTFALEGAIFAAGTTVQWLRDGVGMIGDAAETAALAEAADPEQQVFLVPAFTGLGAPHWDANARAAILGISRGTGRAEIVRAGLEAVAFQTRDLLDAMHGDWQTEADTVLRVDGGMVANDWLLQALADVLDAPVDRPEMGETTALGAAYLAGLAAGVCPEPETFAKTWRLDRQFTPGAGQETMATRFTGWHEAVGRTLSRG